MGDMADECREQEEEIADGYVCYRCGAIIDGQIICNRRLCDECKEKSK